MQNKIPYILGLDVGTNSIGWAVVDCDIQEGEHQGIFAGCKPVSLRALNSRIFLDMLEAKTKVPKNQKRRAARGARNRRAYYKQRRKELVEILIDEGLLPADYRQNPEQILNRIDREYGERKVGKAWSKNWAITEKGCCSPYAMRNFALEEKLEPHEFGRLLLHLQRRRGYFSNRGAKYVDLIKLLSLKTLEDDENAMKAEEKKETGMVLAAISELDKKLNGHTLGQFIWQESQNRQIPPQRITLFDFGRARQHQGKTVIDRLQFRAKREMYEQEFDAIWQKQNDFHRLSDNLDLRIKDKIFYQRPLRSQKGVVGNCNIYPHKKRSALMRLEYQEFRTLQVINNIKIKEKPLNPEQRQQLLTLADDPGRLNDKGRISWKKVASALGVKHGDINYGQGGDTGEGKTGLLGNRTAQAISHSIGIDAWQELGEKRTDLVEDLLTIHDKKALYNRLVEHWKFAPHRGEDNPDKEGALGLAMNEQLEDGYGKHSLKAVKKLLPHLRAGKDYYKAVEAIGKAESITQTSRAAGKDYLLEVEDIPNIANPVVQKALYEIRRVVNSIIKRYGKPAIIRMEMAREMKSSKKHRAAITSQQKANRKRNEDAEEEILEYYHAGKNPNIHLEEIRGGVRRVSVADRNKFKMWKYEQKEKCPYCQTHIGSNQLFSGEAEIEHILPYTGFRQSYMNTVVSCRNCNQEKGKKTPYEAWGMDADRWPRIEEFAKENYVREVHPKQRNILTKKHNPEDEEDFVKRQLNDTRYIAAATKKLLERYGVPIDVNTGAASGELRRRWGLNNVLPREPDSGAYIKTTGEIVDIERYDAERAEKSRQDHRHHAVDAFVVAMTDRAMLKAMIEVHQQEQDNKEPSRQKTREDWIKYKRLGLPDSWRDEGNLHNILREKLNATVVSHMVKRKVWGALHEETLYGKSHFSQRLNIEGMRSNTLKQVAAIAQADINDDTDWIADAELRAVLLRWSQATQKLEPAARDLPRWQGSPLKEFVYQTPCVTDRKELTGQLLSRLDKEWRPGTGTWIAEKSIHDSLYRWLEKHQLVGKSAKEMAKILQDTPPPVLNRNGKPTASTIRRVRIARPLTDAYTKIANSYVQPGSNHHLVLFHNGKEGTGKQRQACMVTMLEAAKRASAGKPVINKLPPPEWDGEWHDELSLCVNDMVKCEDESIFEDEGKFAPEHRETPYFRVQTISGGSKTIDLRLRHHSVSGTDSNWGLWRISSLTGIKCKKVEIGNLGLLPDDS